MCMLFFATGLGHLMTIPEYFSYFFYKKKKKKKTTKKKTKKKKQKKRVRAY